MRLILTRHAKSDWDGMTTDHQRPLSRRGRRAGPLIGQYLLNRGYTPQEALVSDALRTRETFALIADEFPSPIPVHFEPKLYHASASRMLEVLKASNKELVMMIGHNPGIASFAEGLVAAPPKHARFFDYPTGATTIIEFDCESAKDIEVGSGRVLDFVIPREL